MTVNNLASKCTRLNSILESHLVKEKEMCDDKKEEDLTYKFMI